MTGIRQWAMLLALGFLPACASSPARVNPATAVEPQLSVERFLQAANQRDLDAMGIRTMVSIWPTVAAKSRHYGEMRNRGHLLRKLGDL